MSLQKSLLDQDKLTDTVLDTIISLILAALAIYIFVIFLALTGNQIIFDGFFTNIFTVYFTNPSRIGNVLYWATPLILTALAVAIAFQAGLFNIGGQGQMALGGVFTAAWGAVIIKNLYRSTKLTILYSPLFLIPTSLLIGFIAGAIFGFIPGWLKAKTGAHEVITTIMLNQIASSVVKYLVGSSEYSPFISQSQYGYSQTDPINEGARLGKIFNSSDNYLHWGFLISLLVLLIIHIVIYRTNFGFQLRAVGFNKEAAEAAGINSDRMIIYAMTLSGGVAGLAGATFIMGTYPYKYFVDFQGTLGFDGIAVSLIAQNSPLGIAIAAIFFGYLTQTQTNLSVTQIPGDLIFVFQAWVIIFAVAPNLSRMIYHRKKRIAAEEQEARASEESDSSEPETKEELI